MEDCCRCDDAAKDTGLSCSVFHPSLYKAKGSALIYELYKNQQAKEANNIGTPKTFQNTRLFFRNFLGIQAVHAETLIESPASTSNAVPASTSTVPPENTSAAVPGEISPVLKLFAQVYIKKETGMDRIKIIFQRDHQNRRSHEMLFLGQVVFNTYFTSFLFKFIPTWFDEKKKFIEEHRGTIFKTRQQAMKLLGDTVLFKSLTPSAKFAFKITLFSTSMMIISQGISAYRNKSTPMEYIAAGAITGGLFRVNMGIRGMIAGSVLAGLMGTIVGGLVTGIMMSTETTQEERHLQVIVDRLEMERSIIGDLEFSSKMTALMETPYQVQLMANSQLE